MSERAELLDRFETTWRALRAAVDGIDATKRTAPLASGWSAQEMLGHLAFWAECTHPVVVGILRGDAEAIEGWRFGSDYQADAAEPWPVDTVHNAREAAWASEQDWSTVVDRLDRAGAAFRATIGALTDEEVADQKFVDYIEGSIAHVDEHTHDL